MSNFIKEEIKDKAAIGIEVFKRQIKEPKIPCSKCVKYYKIEEDNEWGLCQSCLKLQQKKILKK